MSLDLIHLDPCTRRFMLAELELDIAAGTVYLSPQLSDEGMLRYCQLLRNAIKTGTEDSFAEALCTCNGVRPPSRWQHPREVGPDAALADLTFRLAEREFHRFYLRGLCQRALDLGMTTLVIYRARSADGGRAPADGMIGVRIDARSLLEDLRGTFRSLPPHGLPQCRDPGLSVRFSDDQQLRGDDVPLVARSAAR